MNRSLGVSLPSTVCANCHSARGITLRGALRESRTVRTLRGSCGSETGYSAPPIVPPIMWPSGISGSALEGMRSPRNRPVMVLPWSLAMGAKKWRAPAPVASHCQPRVTMVKPLRSSQASPALCAKSQSPPSTSEMRRPRPRFGTSRIMEPLLLFESLGRTAMKAEENSTSPSLRLTALARSTICLLCGLAMGSEK